MKFSVSIECLVRNAAMHPWRTVGGWALVTIVSLACIGVFLPGVTTSEGGFIGTPVESERAEQLLGNRLRGPEKVNDIIIIRSNSFSVDDPIFRENVENIHQDIIALGSDIVESAVSYYQSKDESLVSTDRHTTIIPIIMGGDLDEAVDSIDNIHDIVHQFDGKNSFQVFLTGDATINKDWTESARKDLLTAELYGIPVALLVLILVFGALVAAAIPLVLGIITILIALGAAVIIGQVWEISIFITNVIFVMGLALGIDYSLFILSRYREECRRGADKIDAIGIAGATAGRAVLFSGMTVVFALLGILIIPLSIFVSIALGVIFVAVAAVLCSLTLLPAILSLLGDRVDRLRVPSMGRRLADNYPKSNRGFWNWTTRQVMQHPVTCLLVVGGLIVAAAIPSLNVNLGIAGVSTLPDSMESKQGFEVLEEDFSYGLISPAEIVIDGPINTESVQTTINRLQDLLNSEPNYFGDTLFEVNHDGNLALISVLMSGDPNEKETMDKVELLRNKYIPEALNGVDVDVLVTGEAAINLDYIEITKQYLPTVFLLVLGLSFLLLLILFRSIVVPVKTIIMNMLSVGAAYGLLVLVFQEGIGADALGFIHIDKFEVWVPIFLFCMLFGLSMDYHIFLLSRIKERFNLTGDNNESISHGLHSTRGVIMGAALIIVTVFTSFATGNLVMFQQMGFGLAVAIFIDATIVRSVLVPSAMRLLGQTNWYFPNYRPAIRKLQSKC